MIVMSPVSGTMLSVRPLAAAASSIAGLAAARVRGSSGTPTVTGRLAQRPMP